MVRWDCFCRSLAKGVSSNRYVDRRQSDASGHWRACSVEGCTDSDHQIPLIQYAGAPATGTAAQTCEAFGYKMADIDPDAHEWNNPVCAWSKDNQSCTTAHVCKNDENRAEADADAIIGRETKAPACTEKGETTYTTAFNVDWASERSKTAADIPASGHTFVPRAEIAASHQTGGTAAHFTCKNCGLLFDAEKHETTPEALVLPKFDHTFGEALESDAEAHWYACGEKSAVFTRTFA